MEWRDRIVSDSNILVGKFTIKGTRISVSTELMREDEYFAIHKAVASASPG